MAEREGAARSLEGNLRREQASLQKRLSEARMRDEEIRAREATLAEKDEVHYMILRGYLGLGVTWDAMK